MDLTKGTRREAESRLELTALRGGTANALVLWFEFSMGRQEVSTQPLALRRLLQQQHGGDAADVAETSKKYYTKAWKQAMVALPPQQVCRC